MDFLPDAAPLQPPFDFDKDYSLNIEPDMYGNDDYNDCVIVARAHQTIRQVWARSRTLMSISPNDVVIEYQSENKQENGGQFNDLTGLDLKTSLDEWQNNGWTYGADTTTDTFKHRIALHSDSFAIEGGTFAGNNPALVLNQQQLQAGIYWNVGAHINLMLPANVKRTNSSSFGPGHPWQDTADSSGDLHVILLTGYDINGFLGITWAQKQEMTWPFLQTHCFGVFFVQPGDNI